MRIVAEQIAALDHVAHAGRFPVQPLERPLPLHHGADGRDAGIHAVQIHRINEIGPFERLLPIVDRQRRDAGGVGIAAGQGVGVGGKRLDRLESRLGERVGGRHARALIVGIAGSHHRCPDIGQLRQIAFAERAARLNHRGDPLVQEVEQHLRELRAGRVIGHGIGANDHHRAHDLFLLDLRTVAQDRAEPEFLQLRSSPDTPCSSATSGRPKT